MIFSLRARDCVNRVGFYTIPYNQARVVGVGSSNAGKHNFSCWKESYYIWDHLVHKSRWTLLDGRQMEVSLLLNPRTSYCCTNSYPVIFFLILFLTIRKKYWIWESVGWGGESMNLHRRVDIDWLSTSQHLTLVRRAKSTFVRYIYEWLTILAPTNEESAWLNEEKTLEVKKWPLV
jgi:hypothetical protein